MTLSLAYGRQRVELSRALDTTEIAARNDGVALDAPAVAERLEAAGLLEALGAAAKIALVVNDQTRKGGMRVTLDAIASLLGRVSSRPAVDLVVAYGLHARQSDEVTRTIYGDAILSRVRVVHHDARDPAGLRAIGEVSPGAPVSIAREVADAELRVLVGAIGFHYYAGFSGGRKAVLPGVADEASIVRNHLRVLDANGPAGRAAGCGPARLDGNPVSDEMFAAARLLDAHGGSVGRTFLANAIVGASGVVDFAAGADVEQTFRAGCERLVARNAVKLDPSAPFDGVIASAGGWPYDAALYQAHKAYDNAFRAFTAETLQRRPPLILLARCDEGLGHPRFGAWLEHETREAHYRELLRRYEIVGQTSLAARDKAAQTRTLAVTDLDEATCARLGWEKCSSVDEAVDRANGPTKAVRRWAVIPSAGSVLPIA